MNVDAMDGNYLHIFKHQHSLFWFQRSDRSVLKDGGVWSKYFDSRGECGARVSLFCHIVNMRQGGDHHETTGET